MEVVGFVAAIASIAKVAQTAGRFAKTIYKVSKEAGTAGDRIKRTALIFESFGDSIQTAYISLQCRCPQDVDSPVIRYIQDHQVLEGLEEHSDDIRRVIAEQRKNLWSVVGPWDWVTSWRWNQMKDDIMELHPQMESIRMSFLMVLQVITLEVTVANSQNRPSGDLEREIESIKRSIEGLVKTIKRLTREQQVIHLHVGSPNDSARSLASQTEDQLRVLCHLGQSFVETEAVPTHSPDEFSFREVRRRQDYRRRHATPTPAAGSTRASAISTAHTDRGDRPTSRSVSNTAHGPFPVPVPSPAPHNFPEDGGDFRPRASRSSKLRKTSRSEASQRSPASNGLGTEKSYLSGTDAQGIDETRGAHGPEKATADKSVEAPTGSKGKQKQNAHSIIQVAEPTPAQTPTSPVQESTVPTDVPQSIHRRTLSGISGGGVYRVPDIRLFKDRSNPSDNSIVNAHADSQLHGNLITEEYAKELGLQVNRLGRHTIKYRDREIVSVGRLDLVWSPRSSTTEREIKCTVCEELEYPLIFGAWFDKAERHMSREEDREIGG